jgi:putative FmdB family regulatory protein
MPIYEYACKSCGNFEIMQRISEDPLKRCPTCGGKINKLISLSAFHLKGSGWYATDYGKGNGSGKDNSSEKKDETKPAGESKETASSTSSKGSSSAAKESSSST